jgi:hypothetical protein
MRHLSRILAAVFCVAVLTVSGAHAGTPAASFIDACRPAYQKLASLFAKPSSASLQDEVRITGRFHLEAVEGHDDIFVARMPDGTRIIFRTDAERATKEVSAYRFAKAAGFEVPQTVYADINGKSGSVQRMVEGLPLASDLDQANNWEAVGAQKLNPATRVFDALLGIKDRNTTNYFVKPDGGQVLIDNEFLFWKNRSATSLVDGQDAIVDSKTIRLFVQSDPERARQLADPINESNYLWALREVSESNRADFLKRLKLYREHYRIIEREGRLKP